MSGLLLGDADIKKVTNGSIFRLRMTNRPFLEWVSEQLSPLSRGVFLSETKERQKESAIRGNLEGVSNSSKFNDLYGIRTVAHSQVNELNNWYSTGQKRYPDRITEEMFRMWYVTDGNKRDGDMRITCVDQTDSKENITSIMENLDFINSFTYDTNEGTIRISREDSRTFWEKTEPPIGFEYKWE